MSYDFEGKSDDLPPRIPPGPPPNPKDLETIDQAISIGAIFLTDKPDVVFTFEQLMTQIRAIYEPEVTFDEKDIRIVLQYMNRVRKVKGGYILT